MREDAFRDWLLNTRRRTNGAPLNGRTVNSRISNCKTVERYEGNLDQQFDQDYLQSLIERLTFSREDEMRDRPARHQIPIDGNIYNGTATVKSAVSLYQEFRENWASNPDSPTVSQQRLSRISSIPKAPKQVWPTWDQPRSEDILELAHLTVPFVRFLSPDVVKAVAEDNLLHREEWIAALHERGIDPAAYLWEKSPCAFPGVRRYAGSREIAAYRGHARPDRRRRRTALALDDNDYPKQLWSFVFRERPFSKFGPAGYALAHLADHKDHGNRFAQDFEVTESAEEAPALYGLYTCPSNAVYIPSCLIKPTDFVGTIRSLLVRRAQELYGAVCNILPPFLHVAAAPSSEWNVREFNWADPVGTTANIPTFLEFRSNRLSKLIAESGPEQPSGNIT